MPFATMFNYADYRDDRKFFCSNSFCGDCLLHEQGDVNTAVEWVESQERIDMAALQARDPILFFEEVILALFGPNTVK